MSEFTPTTALARAFGAFGLYGEKRTDMTAADLASDGVQRALRDNVERNYEGELTPLPDRLA